MNTKPLEQAIGAVTLADLALAGIAKVGQILRNWKHRREVSHLLGFEDHMLADLGLTRQDVEGAVAAPLSHDPSWFLVRARAERQIGSRGVRRSI